MERAPPAARSNASIPHFAQNSRAGLPTFDALCAEPQRAVLATGGFLCTNGDIEAFYVIEFNC